MSRLTVFWALHALAMLVFLGGVWLRVSIWLQGQVEGRAPAPARLALGAAWRFVRRAGFGRALRALLLDGLLHRRLLATDPVRWFVHACLLGAFAALALLSTLTGFAQEVMLHLFGIHHPLVEALVNKDTPLMALANETLGLVMLAGMALIALRRYVRRPAHLRTGPPDTALVALLAVTLLSGYPVEALRLLAEQVPAQLGRYSYAAFPLAQALRPLAWPWEALHYWTFLFHSTLASALLAYVPFSKSFHVVAGPLVATAGSLAGEGQAA